MNTTDRIRAHYSHGIIGFHNPLREAALQTVSFCPSDTMYHLRLHHSPIEDDSNCKQIAAKTREANLAHNGVDTNPTHDDKIISVWFPGNVDLEDMVAIVERVPELNADWLRPEFNKLKIACGLTADDFPYLDRDENYQGCGGNPRWYHEGWISAKGGTLLFSPYADEQDLILFAELMTAEGTICKPLTEYHEGRSYLAMPFHWAQALDDVYKTKQKLRGLFQTVVASRPESVGRTERFKCAFD
ncbi:MAG: hypothetical protein SFW62_00320 [Alphaproteobacteria bacterium]|nr:hypothetical protein [Alphaproteobacteria bacterium]